MHPLFYHQGKLKYSKLKRGSVSCRQSIRQTYYYLYSILSNLTRTKSPRRHFDAELTLAPCVSGRAGARQRLVPPQSRAKHLQHLLSSLVSAPLMTLGLSSLTSSGSEGKSSI